MQLHLVRDVGNQLLETKAFLPDRAAGEAALGAQRGEVGRHMDLGLQKLEARRAPPPVSPPDDPRERRPGDDEHGN